jgi:hypothetical protein
VRAFFKDDSFDFLTRIALGGTFYRCADVGEVLATVDGVKDGNGAQWVAAWEATARRLQDEGEARRAAGHHRSAAAAFLRAAKYHETASYAAYLEKGPEDGVARFDELWERYRDAWDAFLDVVAWPSEPVEIPYEDTTLPGYLVRSGDGARRTLVMNNGSDGSMVDMWMQGALEALERGWNVLLFDGPGQGAAFVRQGLAFRADWEAVLTPVLDWLTARAEVDAGRVAVLGVSQAGYWVPRALSREHRFAAAVVDPGVVDVSTTLLDHFPHSMAKLLAAGEKDKLDRNMRMGERFSKDVAATVALAVPSLWAREHLRRAEAGPGDAPHRRRHRRHRHAAAGHRSGGRAVLARAAQGAVREAARGEGPSAVHPGGGRQLPLRADGPRRPQRADLRLARRDRPGLTPEAGQACPSIMRSATTTTR